MVFQRDEKNDLGKVSFSKTMSRKELVCKDISSSNRRKHICKLGSVKRKKEEKGKKGHHVVVRRKSAVEKDGCVKSKMKNDCLWLVCSGAERKMKSDEMDMWLCIINDKFLIWCQDGEKEKR